MSGNLKKGMAIWIFGFITILALVNVFNSAMMWLQNGETYLFTPYLIGQYVGPLQVTQYFWISVVIGFIFSGCTAFVIFSGNTAFVAVRKTTESEIIQALTAQKASLDKVNEAYRTNLKSHEHIESHIDGTILQSHERLEELIGDTGIKSSQAMNIEPIVKIVKRLSKTVADQEATFAKRVEGLSKTIAKQAATAKRVEGLSKIIAKQAATAKRVEGLSKTVGAFQNELVAVKDGLQSLENALLSPRPKLLAESGTQEVAGIGPSIAKELENIGVSNVGDFLFTDPAFIGENTRLSQDQAERLQGAVQLLMIPGIDETYIDLFDKVGVTNRKELAVQDPFEFNIKLLNAYAKDAQHLKYRKPRFEDVVSWVRIAQL